MNKVAWGLFGALTLAMAIICWQKIQERVVHPSFYGRGNVVRFDTNAAKEFVVYGKDVQVTVVTNEEVFFDGKLIPPMWSGNPIKSASFHFPGNARDGSPTRLNFRWDMRTAALPWTASGAYFEFSAPDGVDVLGVPLGTAAAADALGVITVSLGIWLATLHVFRQMFPDRQSETQPQPAAATS